MVYPSGMEINFRVIIYVNSSWCISLGTVWSLFHVYFIYDYTNIEEPKELDNYY